jgi:hypothetical protein
VTAAATGFTTFQMVTIEMMRWDIEVNVEEMLGKRGWEYKLRRDVYPLSTYSFVEFSNCFHF